MCTGYQVVLTRTAVAEREGFDRLYGPTDSFLPADTSNESVSFPPAAAAVPVLVQPAMTPA